MAKIVRTDLRSPDDVPSQWERDQIYNGLDCCVTAEVLEKLLPQLDETTSRTYDFSRALQGPVLEMRLRGIKVNMAQRAKVIDAYHDQLDVLQEQLERIVFEGVGMHVFNWRSTSDLKNLFYNYLQIPPITRGGKQTVNRDALEKISQYTSTQMIVAHLTAMREIGKKISVLKTEIDSDNRIRTSYNIGGTSTGRFSSSFSEFGTGGNLQNVEEMLRSVFEADPKMKFAKFDAKSGESFCVGAIEWNLFGDDRYLVACESGDPHTAVARICWPNLSWTGNLKEDKDVAETLYYRHYSHRFMCKKLGHGSNYGGKPATLAAQTKLPLEVVANFQPKYFEAFPAHRQWHEWVDKEIRTKGKLISLTGRKRHFFGRRNDPATLREAIAYDPQCSLADIVNDAMLRIWGLNFVTIVLQDHDALTFQYPEEMEDEIIPRLMELLITEVPLKRGRVLRIPYDCKTGWNRGDWNEQTNPDGLKDYKSTDGRRRQPEVSLLDRIVYRKH